MDYIAKVYSILDKHYKDGIHTICDEKKDNSVFQRMLANDDLAIAFFSIKDNIFAEESERELSNDNLNILYYGKADEKIISLFSASRTNEQVVNFLGDNLLPDGNPTEIIVDLVKSVDVLKSYKENNKVTDNLDKVLEFIITYENTFDNDKYSKIFNTINHCEQVKAERKEILESIQSPSIEAKIEEGRAESKPVKGIKLL